MRIRTAIFGVYVGASALGFVALMFLVLRDVRLRYVESMRRTLGDTAAFLAVFAAESGSEPAGWRARLGQLPPQSDLLRVFACEADGRVVFDSSHGKDVGQVYRWSMTGGGRVATEGYTVANVAEVDGELRVVAPVRIAGELRGWVGVGRPLATVAEGVSAARWRLATYAALIAAAMTAAGWWIANRLTHSLERLTEYAQAVRDGRTAAPPASRAKEIEALARAFEEMRVTLEGKLHVERYTQALAHEFKAPLTAIRGAAELLAENPPAEDRARFAANVLGEAERLRRIVERLLELAALESRRAGPASELLEMANLAKQVVAETRGMAEARGVGVVAAVPAALPVQGDAFLLGQALGNLIQNALEFSPPGSEVTVTARAEGGAVVVEVDDRGPGVPDYALARVFERFYSLPRPDTGRKSSGLGLSIVREIARLHRGEVTLANRATGGARATFVLPAGDT
ncbi:MAG: two-component system sensor histidine kinase CreC [Opitutia bacterium Tous-C1TDCM]|nr:MAG: two-component system sensor histidine kinase CreC [Opitutae bacterium Tous-C1TDCM]